MLSALLLAAAAALPLSPARTAEEPAWTPIVAYDEVRVEMDTARVVGRGPFTTWVRWHYLERAASPSAWDAGIRLSLDLLEVDCARGTARTLSSTAYAEDGTVNRAMSVDEPAAAWRALRAGTVGAEVAEKVCQAGQARP
jgi:hypothetical protein